jgi:hypothetical protein
MSIDIGGNMTDVLLPACLERINLLARVGGRCGSGKDKGREQIRL